MYPKYNKIQTFSGVTESNQNISSISLFFDISKFEYRNTCFAHVLVSTTVRAEYKQRAKPHLKKQKKNYIIRVILIIFWASMNDDCTCCKNAKIVISCLRAKPPSPHITSRHNTIFSDFAIFRGGLAFVPAYEMQPSNHQGSWPKDVVSFYFVPKS